jgi:hypothetical protein
MDERDADVIFTGGWNAGAMSRVYGAVPFRGVTRKSEQDTGQPLDASRPGPCSTVTSSVEAELGTHDPRTDGVRHADVGSAYAAAVASELVIVIRSWTSAHLGTDKVNQY